MNILESIALFLRSVRHRPIPQARPRKHYPRAECLVCGKTLALTRSGLWRHRCAATIPTIFGEALNAREDQPPSTVAAADVQPVPGDAAGLGASPVPAAPTGD